MDHLHPQVIRLSKQIGVPILDRDYHFQAGSFAFDGHSVAAYISKYHWKYKDADDFDGVPVFLGKIYCSDHEILHELAHWLMADPCQRDLPEFGLGGGILNNSQHCSAVVDHDVADKQERAAQLFCVIYGKKYGISPAFAAEKFEVPSWDFYLNFKFQSIEDWDLFELVEQALSFLGE